MNLKKKLLVSLATAWIALTVTFIVVRAMPGDVIFAWAQKIQKDQGLPFEQALAMARNQLNYDPSIPWYRQYFQYAKGVMTGDLGDSIFLRVPVIDIIKRALPWTLFIASTALLCSFTVGVALGLVVAWRRKTILDPLVTLYAAVTQAIPDFLIALILLILFAINLRWFPIRGAYNSVKVTPGFNLAFLLDLFYHAALPVAAFTLQSLGAWALAMKGNALSVLSSDYITVARAKGLTERRIIVRYLGKNAILPLVTTFAIALGSMFSGAMLIETLFSYPGLGFFMQQAIANRDYTLLQGLFLVTAFAMIFFTLLADLLYAKLDPRIKA